MQLKEDAETLVRYAIRFIVEDPFLMLLRKVFWMLVKEILDLTDEFVPGLLVQFRILCRRSLYLLRLIRFRFRCGLRWIFLRACLIAGAVIGSGLFRKGLGRRFYRIGIGLGLRGGFIVRQFGGLVGEATKLVRERKPEALGYGYLPQLESGLFRPKLGRAPVLLFLDRFFPIDFVGKAVMPVLAEDFDNGLHLCAVPFEPCPPAVKLSCAFRTFQVDLVASKDGEFSVLPFSIYGNVNLALEGIKVSSQSGLDKLVLLRFGEGISETVCLEVFKYGFLLDFLLGWLRCGYYAQLVRTFRFMLCMSSGKIVRNVRYSWA